MWAILVITLPTQPNAVRLRIWRALKALGCAALRDGAYLLPAHLAHELDALADEARQHGGTASVLALAARDDTQRDVVQALFDRGAAYAQWHEGFDALRGALPGVAETEARRRLRALSDALSTLQGIDYYPGAAAEQAQSDLVALRLALDNQHSKGEPSSHADSRIVRLDARKFQGKRWATRARPWVDRLACAWLIRRFIDPQASFVWLDDTTAAPRSVIGYDYDGARFSHVGARVSFEVLCASFGLAQDERLQGIAAMVHFLDVGGIPVPQAAGLEAVLGGLREMHADDDTLLRAASAVFDALYAVRAAAPGASQ